MPDEIWDSFFKNFNRWATGFKKRFSNETVVQILHTVNFEMGRDEALVWEIFVFTRVATLALRHWLGFVSNFRDEL